jgi:glycosyltransferase involved in cell wall biosynthesis
MFADLMRTCGPGGEGAASGADQGERVFLRELGRRLEERVPTLVYSSTREATQSVRQVSTHRLISRQLAGEIWRNRPRAIVYVYPVTTAALLRSRLMKLCGRGAPTVIIALATDPLERFGGVLRRFLWPDLVLVSSDAERRALAAKGAAVETLPPGVDVDRFRPAVDAAEKQRIRREWGLPQDRAIVLHVGHLVGARNLGVLAALAGRPHITPVVLVSHVRDAESDRLRATLEQAGVVVLEGYRSQVEELYRAADCYVFPSRAWGGGIDLPLSVLEALASGLPVVCTPFGALPERFGNADCVRFATSDTDFVEAVEGMLQLRPPTRQLVDGYSWDAVSDRLLSLVDRSAPAVSGASGR